MSSSRKPWGVQHGLRGWRRGLFYSRRWCMLTEPGEPGSRRNISSWPGLCSRLRHKLRFMLFPTVYRCYWRMTTPKDATATCEPACSPPADPGALRSSTKPSPTPKPAQQNAAGRCF